MKSKLAQLTLLALLAWTMTYYAASLSKTAAAIQGKGAPNSVTSSSTFSNPFAITVNDSVSPPTTATPYPSNIVVSGLGGTISKVTVKLTNINHTFSDDIDVLLVGPAGQSVILMSDAGGNNALSNVTLTFDDASALFLNDASQIVSSTYIPTNYAPADTIPPPAPASPYGATLSVFNGTAPNGTWKLFVVDDANGDSGSILGGWSLTIFISEFVVSNTNNSGAGSLRQAILDANANSGGDTISFNIPGAGVHTISPTSALPDVTDFIAIDATTQPGYAGSPLIELNGAGAGANVDGLKFTPAGGVCTVKGLIINRFSSHGIEMPFNTGDGMVIQGNYIGTNSAGTAALGNAGSGLRLEDLNSGQIGGTTAAARNIISGNGGGGVTLSSSTGIHVEGNYIGTDVTGAVALGNGVNGTGLFLALPNSITIGGTTAGARNVISGNNNDGIGIVGGASNNVVQGNYIGTNAAGTAALGNTKDGVHILFGGVGITIGGTTASARNIISGNSLAGIEIESSQGFVDGTVVQNNFVGTDITGSSPLGNGGSGVVLKSGARFSFIGGGVGLGNVIAFNAGAGVGLPDFSSEGNAILANSIHSNGGLGIDLGNNGVTPNDPLDADSGWNKLQNHPVIGTAANTGTGTFVAGSLNSAASQTYTIEFFSNTVLEPTGYGEGQTFLGAINATTAFDGNTIFNVTLPLTVPAGQYISATATDVFGDTSEFSLSKQVTTAAPTAAEFAAANATGFDDGVLIQWQTGMEVDNLGFNLYRDEYGKRALLNQQLIAGSAFVVGEGVAVRSGFSYQWWDAQPATNAAQYWIESLDLNGSSAWYGPFAATSSLGKEHPASVDQAKTLASLGGNDSPSLQLEPLAKAPSARQASKSQSQPSSLIASSKGVKIAVKQAGYYHVTQPELLAAGLDPACDPRNLQLFVDGREQAISVAGETDGRFDSADAVEFYGVGIDSPFTASHNYFLISATQQGRRIETLSSFAKPNPGGGFAFTTERRDRTIYFSALLNGDLENFFGAVLTSQPLNQTLTVQHADLSVTENATLEVALQGVTNFPHNVTVQLNGATIGYANFNTLAHSVTSYPVDPSLLREGNNTVTLRTTGNPADVSLVDYLRLTYQHKLDADNDSLRFTAQGQQQITIEGFSNKSIRVFDVTNPDAVDELEGAIDETRDGFNVSIHTPGTGQRTLLAVTDATTKKAARITLNSPSALQSTANAAQFVIIAHQAVMDKALVLRNLRQAQGLSSAVVDIEDIYDEFSFGQKTPFAVRDFLAFAGKSWRVPVRYALLFGDASCDAKNYLGLGEFDQVPTRLIDTTFLEAASDDWLADFNNDGVADLAIGRLPVRNDGEAGLMIKKLIGYDQSKPSEEVLGVADRNEGYDFEHAIDQLKDLVPGDLRTVQVKRGQSGDAAAKAALLEAINRGQQFVSYSGHGSANVWRGNLLTNADAGQLQNKESLAVFLIMNCLNGYFVDPGMDSLSEALLKAPLGGAVAVWASSAMTYPDSQSAMSQEMYRQLFSNRGIRIGDAIVRAKAAALDMDVRQTWILFADPTMQPR